MMLARTATLRRADRNALLTEAVQLCAFVAPQAKCHIVLDQGGQGVNQEVDLTSQ